ncbi:MAG: hypothetical protein SV253_02885 [Halobacteria archaeon]|nr:hypothetical protein [Halobacteria archaeon]
MKKPKTGDSMPRIIKKGLEEREDAWLVKLDEPAEVKHPVCSAVDNVMTVETEYFVVDEKESYGDDREVCAFPSDEEGSISTFLEVAGGLNKTHEEVVGELRNLGGS